MTAQIQFFQSLPHKKADFVKKKPVELGVVPAVVEVEVVEYAAVVAAEGAGN